MSGRGEVSGGVADADERADGGGDDDEGGVNRRASGDGHARLSEPSLYIAGESWAESNQYQELTPLC